MSRRWHLTAFVVVLLLMGYLVSAQVTVPYPNFTIGTIADPAQVNADFAALSSGALNRTGGTMTGTLTSRSVIPTTTATYSLGDSSHTWSALYAPATNLTLPSQAQYDLAYAATASTWGRLANGVTGQVLTATTSGAPSWSTAGGLGRCSLVLTAATGNPYPTTDVTAATSVYVTPIDGGDCAFYDGSASWTFLTNAEVTIPLGTLTADLPYDIFCYNNAGTMACDAPLAWTSTSARATALALQNNILVKTGATSRRYMGTFETATTTTTEMSCAKQLVDTYYNRKPRCLRSTAETTDSWSYSVVTTWRRANNSASNQVQYVIGVAGPVVDLTAIGLATGDNTGAPVVATGIGLDSTSALGTGCLPANDAQGNSSYYTAMVARCSLRPAAGVHTGVWLEGVITLGASTTVTWFGDKGNASFTQTGIMGTIN